MKQILSTIAVAALFLTACNNQPAKTEEKPAETKAAPVMAKPAFEPYTGRFVVLTVKDFDKWDAAMQAKDSLLKASGITSSSIGRELDDDKKVVIFSTISDIQKAKDFDGSANRKAAMKSAGATGGTTPTYWKFVMDDTSHIAQMERTLLIHHVKDYDKWKKVFDAEGMDTRKANGFYERGIARGIDEPNTVALLLVVTDAEKYKARMNSPELKKIMEDAGVEGKPEVYTFKWVRM